MNIPQLHTNLFWDLSCLTIFLSGLYFSCIIFFRSPFWKSVATSACFLELLNLGKFHLLPVNTNQEINDTKDPDIDYIPKKNHFESVYPEIGQGTVINDIEVDYEVLIDPAIEKQIHEILESYAKEHREKEVIFHKEQENNSYKNEGDMLDFGNMALPTAKFYSKKENKRVKLLYAIAELGDTREVPLLQGMLDQERNESIGILIKEIILGFLSERPPNRNQESKTPEIGHLCEHYVYKYLFRAIDTESQHLLLDEVLKIGGQEELNFLKTLTLHPDEGIREKAIVIGNILEQKLQPPQQDGIIAELEVPKRKGTHLNNRFGISFVHRIGEIPYLKFLEMGRWVSSYIKISLTHLAKIGNKMEDLPLESPILRDITDSEGKDKSDILQIDFELDAPEIMGQEIDLDKGKEQTWGSNRFHPLKQLISTVLNKMGNLPKV